MMRDMNIVFVCLLLAGLSSLVELRRFRPDGDSDIEYDRNSRHRSSAHYKRGHKKQDAWDGDENNPIGYRHLLDPRDFSCLGKPEGTDCPELYVCPTKKGKSYEVDDVNFLNKQESPQICRKVCINHEGLKLSYLVSVERRSENGARFHRRSNSSSESPEQSGSCDVCLCKIEENEEKPLVEGFKIVTSRVGLCNRVTERSNVGDCHKVSAPFFF